MLGVKYGIELTSFVLENVSVPPEVEQAIDKRSGMAAVGDLNDFINSSNSFFKHLLVTLEARAERDTRLDRLELNLRHDTDLEYQKRRRRFMKRLTAVVEGEVVYNHLPDKIPMDW